jgi:hypothetical protein
MYIGGRYRNSLVSIEKGVVLNQALEEGRRLGYPILVIPCLWPEHGTLECTEVTDSVGSPELVDKNRVEGEYLDDTEVLGHLLG